MAASCTAVLDVGRTHTRLALVARDGTLRGATARDTPFLPGPPYPHVDDAELFGWLCGVLHTTSAEHDVEAIVPVAHGATAALVVEDALALPILDYEYDELPRLDAGAFEETFSPELPGGLNLARQLAWQEAAFPEDFARARLLLLYPQFWTWKLTGRAVSEVTSLGCHTHLWAPRERTFSRLARERGWQRLFPPLVDAWEEVGKLRADLAECTGLRSDCRVHAGIHDSNAAFLAHRAGREAPFAVVSTGTWVVCMAHGTDLDRLEPGRDMLANVDALGEPIACMRFAGGREYAAIAGDVDLAADVADARRIVREKILALPSFSDRGGPFAGRAGRFVPDAPEEGRVALACLYCALMIDLELDALGARGDIVVEGPMARNTLLVEILAALRASQAVLASDDPSGSVRGAALLAHWSERATPPRPDSVAPAEIEGLLEYRALWREHVDQRG